MRLFACSLLVLFVSSTLGAMQEDEVGITVRVDPGKVECYFHTVQNPASGSMEVNWMVLKGGSGLDITFTLRSPSAAPLSEEVAKQHGRFNVDFSVHPLGDYVMCFDNKMSMTSEKIVSLHMYVMDKSGNYMSELNALNTDSSAHLEARLDFFEGTTMSIKSKLTRIESLQSEMRRIEFIDRGMAESTFESMNFWGIVNTIAMLTAAGVQVFLIRSILSDESTVGRVLRRAKLST
ncbi:unnamed protein product, partial [Mesorhabditis spiculigera]